ncbi:MAG: HugZ family protein, partial [Rhizobiaceae bacterium]|nr:HugZ family protein [Rhizobiaceae bacterium]
MEAQRKDVYRETDAAAVSLARRLTRTARFAGIAVIDPETGAPLASRVGVATDIDGAPLILVSLLSAHTQALLAEPRCSLLVGEPGKGDPLAYPRLSIACRAYRLVRESEGAVRAGRRYLNRNPKASLYAELGDFHFFRLEPTGASLNGGFGKAYRLTRDDLLADGAVADALAAGEQHALDHMNSDHRDAVAIYATVFAKGEAGNWTLTGIDPDGVDLALGD